MRDLVNIITNYISETFVYYFGLFYAGIIAYTLWHDEFWFAELLKGLAFIISTICVLRIILPELCWLFLKMENFKKEKRGIQK